LDSLQNHLHRLQERLKGSSESYRLDAQVLLSHVLQKPRAWLLAHPEAHLTPDQRQELEQAVQRLERGEPLPYVLGHWEFYGLDFLVSPAVLIPRPETELLVEYALRWLQEHPGRRSAADIGTGSGCIAVSLAVNVPDLQVIAGDISPAARQVARSNAARHDVTDRVHCIQTDLLSGVEERFDLICANLPYIPTEILQNLDVARAEPWLALDGGPDGLSSVRRLLQDLPARLAPGGLALLEIEASQGAAARQAAGRFFKADQVSVLPDLAGRDRLLIISNQ